MRLESLEAGRPVSRKPGKYSPLSSQRTQRKDINRLATPEKPHRTQKNRKLCRLRRGRSNIEGKMVRRPGGRKAGKV